MVPLGNLSMSCGDLTKNLERLPAEIDQLLERANRTNAEQDAALDSRRGDELPEKLKRREGQIEHMRVG